MNELVLSNNLNQIELEINHFQGVAGHSIWEIGRRLNHVKENGLAHGEFMEWLENVGIEHTSAKRMMKVAKEIPNSKTLHHLGKTTLYLIATLPDEEKGVELAKAEAGDPSTVRELQEIKKQLKEKDRQLEQSKRSEEIAMSQLEEVQNQPPKVIEKEVMPEDYQQMKRQNKDLQVAVDRLKKDVDEMECQLVQQGENSMKYEELNRRLQEMNGQLTEGQKRIQAQKDIYRFVEEGNKAIEKLSTLIYLVDEKEMSINEYAREPIEKIIESLDDISRRLSQKINQTVIIEGEIIHE